MAELRLLLVQVVVVLGAARVLGVVFKAIRQPAVLGEMVAGLVLGPSLLGHIAPALEAAVFPPESLGSLSTLSAIGLVLFMFDVGLHFRLEGLRELGRAALATSYAGIALPFLMGFGTGYALHSRLSGPHTDVRVFALFMGAAMSITAFPVLARILTERGLMGSRIGTMAIACAAVDDVTAWSVLALVSLMARPGLGHALLLARFLALVAYTVLMVTGVRRALRPMGKRSAGEAFPLTMLFLLVSSLVTESLGVHAVFGAFLAGAVMPKERAAELSDRIHAVTMSLFVPLFFAITGLRTRLDLVHGIEGWLECALIVAVAIVGKLFGCALAARATGMSGRDALAIGALMNTRGLMELILLGIGLDLGLVSPALFSMMVLMALVTTFMTAPLLGWIGPPLRASAR
jgi:Kef-type K+ transport system membrane component KefB